MGNKEIKIHVVGDSHGWHTWLELERVETNKYYCDKEGFLIRELSDGHVHIKGSEQLKNWVERKIEDIANV